MRAINDRNNGQATLTLKVNAALCLLVILLILLIKTCSQGKQPSRGIAPKTHNLFKLSLGRLTEVGCSPRTLEKIVSLGVELLDLVEICKANDGQSTLENELLIDKGLVRARITGRIQDWQLELVTDCKDSKFCFF